MEVVITGRQMRIIPALKRYIEERAEKMEKCADPSSHVVWTLKTEKHRQIAEANLHTNGFIFQAQEETDEMYASVDGVVKKIERQLKKYKEKHSDHRVRPAGRVADPGAKKAGAVMSEPLRKAQKRKASPSQVNGPVSLPNIDRETVLLKLLTVEEALSQMKLEKKEILAFRNRANKQCSLLYKKGAGRIGLIELSNA
jgi:putative sigma-54 modulation protein